MASNYAIALVADYNALSSEDKATLFNALVDNSFDTTRKSLDVTKFIGEWEGDTCPFDAVSVEHTDYSYAEMLLETVKPEWLPGDFDD